MTDGTARAPHQPGRAGVDQHDERGEGVALWALFLRTHAAVVRRLDQELVEATGLPLRWYDVLLELNAAPDRRLRMRELGDRVVLSRSRVSRVVDELAAKGLVHRKPDPADGRGAYAVLSDAGRAALRSSAPVYLAGIEAHFARHLTGEQRAAMRAGLHQVLSAQEALQAREAGRRAPLPTVASGPPAHATGATTDAAAHDTR
jgi:DNA-binding MarR family transcriptional regulator